MIILASITSFFFTVLCWLVAIAGFFTYIARPSVFFVVTVILCIVSLEIAPYYFVYGGGSAWIVSMIFGLHSE